jgi:hypothetical protein
MKTKLFLLFTVLMVTLTACQTATAKPLPSLTAKTGAEFTLASDQIVTITDASLTIQLIGVTGDERCPSQIECAASGPVSLSLSVQKNNEEPSIVNLQTFTDNNGRAPDFEFESIKNYTVYDEYIIRVTGILPYPVNLSKQIETSDYRVTLTVTQD